MNTKSYLLTTPHLVIAILLASGCTENARSSATDDPDFSDSDSDGDSDGDSDSDSDSDSDGDTPTDGDHSDSGLTFSDGRGIYDEPFDVVISHPFAERIKYTLDASNPITSTTAISADLPATIHIDPEDTDERYLAPGVVLRAVPDDDEAPTFARVSTHTYLFIKQVVALSPDGEWPGGDWPQPGSGGSNFGGGGGSVNGQWIDYGMDPDVCNSSAYRDQIVPALESIPTVSLVTDLPNLFDSDFGIFVNAEMKSEDPDPSGAEEPWERPASFEIINPDGSDGLQANCGVRIRGGYSRNDSNPKHAFKLYFRGKYGVDKLHFPLFGDEGPDEFDRIDLRTSGNYSWSFDGSQEMRALNTMNRDVFSRDLQRELGEPYTRSRYYHLYLDGVYWGIFQSQERVDSSYAKTYFGGEKDEYDIIKSNKLSDNEVIIEVSDGTEDSWMEVWDRSERGFESDEDYYALEGRDPEGERDPDMKVYVNIDNLIDVMLITFITGNFDGMTSSFFENKMPNNFYAATSRTDPDRGFVFFPHDNEHSLRVNEDYICMGVNEDRVNIAEVDYFGLMTVSDFPQFHPQWLHHKLSANKKYQERFAARAEEVMENGGPLTPERTAALFASRAAEIETAIIAESARWGDAQASSGSFGGGGTVMTKNDHWVPAVEGILNQFFPQRTDIVIDQLREAGLYPN